MGRLEQQFRETTNRRNAIAPEVSRLGEQRARLLADNIELDQKGALLAEQITTLEAQVNEMATEDARMVDLKQKPLAPGEIKRFIERFGLAGLLDSEGKAYTDAGLKYYKLSDAELLGRIERDPNLLKLPLIRGGKVLSIGRDEESWKAMLATG